MAFETARSSSAAHADAEWWASPTHRAIHRALAYMRAHCSRRLPLAEVASVAHMSRFHFSRVFHRIVGVTFQDHLVRLRLRNAEQMIQRDPYAPLVRVAARTGFGTLRNLEDHYGRLCGYPPSHGRAKASADAAPWSGEQDPSPAEQDTAPRWEQRLGA